MDVSTRGKGLYVFGPFRLDPTRRILTRDGALVALTPTMFDTLLFLVENPGRVVTKAELLDAVWPGRFVDEANIKQTIFTLRKALGGDLILTAPGRGYRFPDTVRWESGAATDAASEAPSPAVPDSPAVPAANAPDWAHRRRVWAAAAGGLFLILILAAAIGIWRWRDLHARALGPGHTVVVADFQNQTRDPIFDRTLGAVLRIDLGQSPFLNVLTDGQVRDTLVLMTRPGDTPLTPPVAREVCARNNADAVLEGAVAAIGTRYLLTLTASDCSGARVLAQAKAYAGAREAVVPALDRLIGRVRRELGESMDSVRKFDAPLERQRTASLDALKAYSEGTYLYDHGHRMESIPLFQRAIALDQNFAAPYLSLSAIYYAFGDDKQAAANIEPAYALRDTVNERERLRIVSRYHIAVTKDLDAAIRALQVWSEVYPADIRAWSNLAVIEDSIGRHAQAVQDARRALALGPTMEAPYMTLAQSYLRSGLPDEAETIGALAVKKGLAGDATHGVLLRIAFEKRDGGGVAREIAWARGNQGEDTSLALEWEMALGRGQVAAADAFLARAVELGRQQGARDDLDAVHARFLADLGLVEQARARLSRAQVDDDGNYLFTLAEIGDPARAEAMLTQTLRQNPRDTLLNAVYASETRAALALRRGKPADAVAALAPALPYEARDFDVPYLLGSAWLAAGDGPRAAAAFRTVLGHQGWDAVSPLYVLARLGLARADRLQGDLPAARRDYQAFLAAWKDADPDVPILQAAKAEYARLS